MNKKQKIEFLNRLEGKEGCNFRKNKKGKVTWNCGGNDKAFAKKILTKMKIGKVEQEKFFDICSELGGHCDCEIIFNAKERLLTNNKTNMNKEIIKIKKLLEENLDCCEGFERGETDLLWKGKEWVKYGEDLFLEMAKDIIEELKN